MICVIAFCSRDVADTSRLLSWITDLGGCPNHNCLLVADASVPWQTAISILGLTNKAFRSTKIISTDKPLEGAWPEPQNGMFLFASDYIEKNVKEPFLWLEPDVSPLSPKWLEAIDAEYYAAGKPFMGKVYRFDAPGTPFLPMDVLSGIAVYPADTSTRLKGTITSRIDIAWDVTTAHLTVPEAHPTNLIHWLWGEPHNPPRFAEANIAGTNTFCLKQLKPGAVLFHRNKDGTLIYLLRKRMFPEKYSNVYAHGGDVGDLMYGLPAMKTIGPGCLVLHHHSVREPFTQKKFELLAPLLRLQRYFTDVQFQKERPIAAWNFNPFREYNWKVRGDKPETLAASHFRIFKLPEQLIEEPWLEVDYPVKIPDHPVVFHRSPRYHNARFPWRSIHAAYGKHAVFVGSPEEHQAFCAEVGPVSYFPTADYLALARVIAGCTLFVGNQSCPYAIAEGLKQNAILESFYWAPDCQFKRKNLKNDLMGRIRVVPLEHLGNPDYRPTAPLPSIPSHVFGRGPHRHAQV